MPFKDQYQTLFAYHFHTTFHLLEHAARLDEVPYKTHPGYGHGSIHDLFVHMLSAEWSWRISLETGQQPARRNPEDFPDFASVKASFEQERAAYTAYLNGLSEEEIEGIVNLTTRQGNTFPISRWKVFQHIVFHGMQHHTEIAQLLTAHHQSPGDIDFIYYV